MTSDLQREELRVRRYLLGAMGEAEREQFEAALFDDDDFFRFVEAVEYELVRDFVCGALPRDERACFERACGSSPALGRKVAQVSALAHTLTAKPKRFPDFRRLLFPLAAAAAVAGVGLSLVVWRGGSARVSRVSSGRAGGASLAALVLEPGATRAAAAASHTLVLRGNAPAPIIELVLPAGAVSADKYDVVLESVDGDVLRTIAADTHDRRVRLEFPGANLAEGGYVLRLRGATADEAHDVATYQLLLLRE